MTTEIGSRSDDMTVVSVIMASQLCGPVGILCGLTRQEPYAAGQRGRPAEFVDNLHHAGELIGVVVTSDQPRASGPGPLNIFFGFVIGVPGVEENERRRRPG